MRVNPGAGISGGNSTAETGGEGGREKDAGVAGVERLWRGDQEPQRERRVAPWVVLHSRASLLR